MCTLPHCPHGMDTLIGRRRSGNHRRHSRTAIRGSPHVWHNRRSNRATSIHEHCTFARPSVQRIRGISTGTQCIPWCCYPRGDHGSGQLGAELLPSMSNAASYSFLLIDMYHLIRAGLHWAKSGLTHSVLSLLKGMGRLRYTVSHTRTPTVP